LKSPREKQNKQKMAVNTLVCTAKRYSRMTGKLEGTRQKFHSLYTFPFCFGYICCKVEILYMRRKDQQMTQV